MPSAFTATAQTLLPHAGEMVLLGQVLVSDPARTRCAASLNTDNPFAAPADLAMGFPPGLALEMMAQCAAVHNGLARQNTPAGSNDTNAAPAAGYLVKAHKVIFNAGPPLSPGMPLLVEARLEGEADSAGGRAASFSCAIHAALPDTPDTGDTNAPLLAEGRLTVWLPDAAGEAAP